MLKMAIIGVVALMLAGCESRTESVSENTVAEHYANGVSSTAASELIFCKEINRRTTKADCDDLTNTAAQAKAGTAAFNVPDMVRGQTSPIQLAISLDPPPVSVGADAGVMSGDESGAGAPPPSATPTPEPTAVPSPGPAPAPPPARHPRTTASARGERPADVVADLPGRTEQYSPLVGRDMHAELIGEGFTVAARSPASQTLNPGGTTTWEWDVTPLKAANYTLSVKTSVEGVMANGQRVVLGSTTRTRRVMVKVRWYDSLRDGLSAAPGWIKLGVPILGALTLLVLAWRRLMRAIRGKEEHDTPAR